MRGLHIRASLFSVIAYFTNSTVTRLAHTGMLLSEQLPALVTPITEFTLASDRLLNDPITRFTLTQRQLTERFLFSMSRSPTAEAWLDHLLHQ